jgi:hypothetical protein
MRTIDHAAACRCWRCGGRTRDGATVKSEVARYPAAIHTVETDQDDLVVYRRSEGLDPGTVAPQKTSAAPPRPSQATLDARRKDYDRGVARIRSINGKARAFWSNGGLAS